MLELESTWCRTALQLPVLSMVGLHCSVSLDQLIHTHMEVNGQSTVELHPVPWRLFALSFEFYLCSAII